jgi:hypothetical protein
MMTKSNILFAGFLLGSVAACGDDGGGASVETFANDLTRLTCEKAAGCCAPIELKYQFAFSDVPVTDQASCEAYLGNFLGGTLAQIYQQSIDSGRASWNADVAADCLADLEALSCDEYSQHITLFGDAPLGCNPVTPNVADGGECVIWWECTSGYCDEGTCQAVPGEGDACPMGMCGANLRCDFVTETCQTYKADGEACEMDAECASNGCSETYDGPGVCGEPSVCDDDLTDDENELYGQCRQSETAEDSRAIECTFGTSGQWECTCELNGAMSTCTPGSTDETMPVCENYGCCGF